jgi:mannose-1-phosphate guanylyltransferase/phosphomannomutase
MVGYPAEGYWCDIGNCESYLKCNLDALEGIVGINIDAPNTMQLGIWSNDTIDGNIRVIPPVYIGKNVVIEKGATIGPCSVIGSGSYIASGAVVERSVIDNAVLHKNVTSSESVVCKGASIGAGTSLNEGPSWRGYGNR